MEMIDLEMVLIEFLVGKNASEIKKTKKYLGDSMSY